MSRGRRRKRPPYNTIGLVALMVMLFACPGLYLQFRGEFTPKAKSTLVAARAGW
jgi:phospholipid/cholesterol/gamma-HCH transport system substrate-binding protein